MVNHRGGWRPVTYQQQSRSTISSSSSSNTSGISFFGGFFAASGSSSNDVGSYGFSMGKTRRAPRCSSCCCSGVGAGLAWFAPSPRLLLLALLVLAIPSFDGGVLACGPGRGGGRRPTLRKLTPLVFKQHVPNVSENTLPASGISEGAIVRHDARFRDLVPNYNSDIIFKDEEGTGADRLMTQRCKEKLNTLAISVMNQWPGVKLRVTEGWDEQGKHAMDSLHYEGRAVDVTTSDRDRSKNGMLARLAVEAGFDWVYYESKSHIHCSVKTESSSVGKSGGCFPARSVVRTEDGSTKRVDELTIGERVAALDSRGDLVYSEVIAFLDRAPEERRQFVRLTTETGRQLTLTPAHLVPVNRGTDVFAAKVKVGDRILVRDDATSVTTSTMDDASIETNEIGETSRLRWDKVVEAKLVLEEGVYAPLTTEGTLLVDDVVASCYAIVDSQSLAHYAFLPLRLLNTIQTTLRAIASSITDGLALSRRADVDADAANSIETEAGARHDESSLVQKLRLQPRGVHWYASALYSISSYVLPGSMLY